MKQLIYSGIVVGLLFCLSACEKLADLDVEELPAGVTESVQTLTSQYGSIQSTGLMVQEVMLAYVPAGGTNSSLPSCLIATPDPDNKTVKLDFGSGCTMNGFVFKGSCIISYSGNFGQEGSSISALFSNFGVNDVTLNGKIEFKDFIKKGSQVEYRLVTTNLSLLQESKTYVFNIDLKQIWKSGYNTTTTIDNEISTEVSGSYKDANGATYALTTTSALLTLGSCTALAYPVPLAGILDMVPNSGPKITVDFGTGNCDSLVKVTTAGKSKEVDLSK